MWQQMATFVALPLGLAVAVLAAPLLRQTLGALVGAAVVGAGVGILVLLGTGAAFASLVIGAMAFAFALLASSGRAARWVSRNGGSPALPSVAVRGRGVRFGGGASGTW